MDDSTTLARVIECVNRQIQQNFDLNKVAVFAIPSFWKNDMTALTLVATTEQQLTNANIVSVYDVLLIDTCQLPETHTDRSAYVMDVYTGLVKSRRNTLLQEKLSNVKHQINAGFIALETKDLLHEQTCESFVRSGVHTALRYLN